MLVAGHIRAVTCKQKSFLVELSLGAQRWNHGSCSSWHAQLLVQALTLAVASEVRKCNTVAFWTGELITTRKK